MDKFELFALMGELGVDGTRSRVAGKSTRSVMQQIARLPPGQCIVADLTDTQVASMRSTASTAAVGLSITRVTGDNLRIVERLEPTPKGLQKDILALMPGDRLPVGDKDVVIVRNIVSAMSAYHPRMIRVDTQWDEEQGETIPCVVRHNITTPSYAARRRRGPKSAVAHPMMLLAVGMTTEVSNLDHLHYDFIKDAYRWADVILNDEYWFTAVQRDDGFYDITRVAP